MKVVIMAGGKGTRITEIASDVPKPMIKINGKPVLEYEIENLCSQGYTDILLVVGHLGHIIQDYFEDGSRWNVKIEYFVEEEPLGTAGSFYYLKNIIKDDFFLLNGDVIMDIDFARMEKYHHTHKGKVTLLTHPNNHPYDSALIVTDENHRVTNWINKEEPRTFYKNRVNAGVHILSKEILQIIEKPGKYDLDRDVLKKLVESGDVYAYDSPEYIKDMGTPERFYAVSNDLISGKIAARNLRNKQKAVFLDRDGTINKYKGFITNPSQIELIPGAATAIKKINSSGYLAIIITNQPVIARGDCSFKELEDINNTLETQLGHEGAYIDSIFICPHHPDKGFDGERPEYKINCSCRKPKPGLIIEAANRFNIDLSQSYMVGDSENDLIAGNATGCKSIYIGSKEIQDTEIKYEQYNNLLHFVDERI